MLVLAHILVAVARRAERRTQAAKPRFVGLRRKTHRTPATPAAKPEPQRAERNRVS